MDTTRLETLFHDLLEVPPGIERNQAAARLSEGDADLARRALALVAADEKATASNRAAHQIAAAPRTFGNYRTVRLLGSGGMGSVYLAERADGQFTQTVALKILAPHAAGESFRERFLSERQILAGLSHPNITKLLDGGVTDDGTPYLVLEYVDGQHLDRYCDEHRLSVRERLEMFRKVCEPVAYAHRNLVVHRDLKPSNILVTHDGQPMLLDFGTAKLLAEADPAITATTPLLTVRYSSPEQRLRAPVTTSTDVFSLGVVLYELLTGAWPFGDPLSPEQMLQRFAKETPMTAPDKTVTEQASQARSSNLKALQSSLAGDLTSILRKALNAEPELRYETVQAFSADIENYLNGRPVSAQAPSFAYRSRKFLRRHWLPVTAAAVFVLGLLGATLYALRQSQIARAEARKSAQVSDFLNGMLASASSASYDPKKFTVVQMLDAAEPLLAASWKNDPAIEAALRISMGSSYSALQSWDRAKSELERSLAISRTIGDREGEARALLSLAANLSDQGATAPAEPVYRAALDAVNRLGKNAPPDLAARARWSYAYLLTEYLYKDRDYALKLDTEAIDLLEHKTPLDSPQLVIDRGLAYFVLGRIYVEQGKIPQGEAALNRSIEIFRQGQIRSVFASQPVYSLMIINNRAGNHVKAKDYARQWYEILRDTVGPDHMLTAGAIIVWARMRAETGEAALAADEAVAALPVVRKYCPPLAACLWTPLNGVSHTLNLAGRFAEAEPYAREEIKVCEQEHLAEADPRLAGSILELGKSLAGQRKLKEAQPTLERAAKIYESLGPAWANSAVDVRRRLQECCAR